MTTFAGIHDPMATCGICLHTRTLHRKGPCALVSGCSCAMFVESRLLVRPVDSWMPVVVREQTQKPARSTR